MKYLVLFLLFFSSATAFSSFDEAIADYEQGHYQSAYQKFKNLAEIGNAASQFNLGVMYYQGQHVQRDVNKAYAWIKLSLQGTRDDDNEFSQRKSILDIVEKEVVSSPAESEFKKLNRQYGLKVLAETLYPKLKSKEAFPPPKVIRSVKPRFPTKIQGKSRSRRLVEQEGVVRMKFDIDESGRPRNIVVLDYFPSKIFIQPTITAFKNWVFEPAKYSNGGVYYYEDAHYTFAYDLTGGVLMPQKRHVKEILKGVEQGNVESEFLYGFILQQFRGFQDSENYNDWYLKAALKGHALAQYSLGKNMVLGSKCEVDQEKGIKWLTRAVANGQSDAQLELGRIYAKQMSEAQQARAIKLLKDNIKQTNSDNAKFTLLKILLKSPYEPLRDYSLALELLDSMEWESIYDPVTPFEFRSYAYAGLGDYESAFEAMKEAVETARDNDYYYLKLKQKRNQYKRLLDK
ncbi:energy transducer TonB [Pleionea sediminis]|uniref:energy transducer TonB n=1 Tax=Pleionea sediminis TaxID=2569479 RepID=UPI0013DDDEC3|nr:energy transducer TonB [Pleionea sediminis]